MLICFTKNMKNFLDFILAAQVIWASQAAPHHHENRQTTRNHLRGDAGNNRKLQEQIECSPLPTDRYFQIINRDTQLAMHVSGASTASGALIVQEYLDEGSHDNWRLVSSGFGGYYHVLSEKSGLALAVQGGSYDGNAPIIQETFTQEHNQDWCFIERTPGFYEIRNRNSGQAIHGESVPNVENDGNPVFQFWYWGGPMQEWRLDVESVAPPAPETAAECVGFPINTFIHLRARHSGKVMGVDPAETTIAGANVVQNLDNTGEHDNWSFVPTGNGYYHLMNQASGMALSLDGMNVVQAPASLTEGYDDWCFVDVDDGYYSVINKETGNGLDIEYWSYDDGANLSTWGYYGGQNQQFQISLASTGGAVTELENTPPTLPPQEGNPNALAPWDGPHATPVVAVAIANLPNGKILMWSAYLRSLWDYDTSKTWTAIYDPETDDLTEKLVENTNHDMFCPGTAILEDGTIMITGGATSTATTMYDPHANSWTVGPKMVLKRGYHSMATLADGSVFTIGGSWHGSVGGKGGEIWNPITNQFHLLPNVPVTPILTKDLGGEYRADNHAWLFTAPDGRVFHVGPSSQMNWIDVNGSGSITPAGIREPGDRMNGNALVIDNGIIFVTGGAANYDTGAGTKNTFLVDVNDPENVVVKKVGDLNYARTLSNSCVLPSGEVVVTGGQSTTLLFSDEHAVMQTELYNPITEQFTLLADLHIPRTYHATSVLLKDGRVMVAGGGLCGGCAANHKDFEILTPPYLLDDNGELATRPVITSAPTSFGAGSVINIQVDTAQLHNFALVRISSATHAVNNDQRRIPLEVLNHSGSFFEVQVPMNPNVALTGVYYLFAMNSQGVPSKGVDVQINAVPAVAPTASPTPGPVAVEPFSDDGKWIEIASNAPIDARHENCFTMVDNPVVGRKAYLAGGRGSKALNIFDPITRKWSTGAPPPLEFHHTNCVAAQGKLWVVAAWTGEYPTESNLASTLVYDPATDSWSSKAGLPPNRRRGASGVTPSNDEKTIYVSHGTSGGHETGDHAESLPYLDAYDIETDSWTALSSSAPNPRDHCGAAVIGGRVCVAGGRNGGVIGWPDVTPTDCYNLETGVWEVEDPIPTPRAGVGAAKTCDGRLMIAGGEGSTLAWDTVEVFDGVAWKTLDSMVSTRHGTSLAVDCFCNQIHIASGAGSAGSGPELKSVETYFPNGIDTRCTARTMVPSVVATSGPSFEPSEIPSIIPSKSPSVELSAPPAPSTSDSPSVFPSMGPSAPPVPSTSESPSASPSTKPSVSPTTTPSSELSSNPTSMPTPEVVSPINVAAGKQTIQSSTAHGGVSSRAVDGSNNGFYSKGSVTHTDDQDDPWWEVDLGQDYNLGRLIVSNRKDCCMDRLSKVNIFVSRTSMKGRSLDQLINDPSVSRHYKELVGDFFSVESPGYGRFVRVQLSGFGVLSLAEVEAFPFLGTSASPPPSIKYGEPIVLKLDVDQIDRYLSGGRSSGNDEVDTRDFRTSEYEKSVFHHHYTWILESTADYNNDEKTGEAVKYGDTVYMRVLSNRWLSGGRSSGNYGVVARDFFQNSYEQNDASFTYRFTVRSILGNGEFGVSSSNPDPWSGDDVTVGSPVVFQLAGGVENRWITGGRSSGNKNVYTRDFYSNDYEQSNPRVYAWRPILADQVEL